LDAGGKVNIITAVKTDALTFDTRSSTFSLGRLNVSRKPIRRSNPAKEQGEFGKFSRLLDRLLRVPHDKIKAELDAEKSRRAPKRKRAAVGHAFRDTD
jgi:hypothetical protein